MTSSWLSAQLGHMGKSGHSRGGKLLKQLQQEKPVVNG